jgi:hypothetical protein
MADHEDASDPLPTAAQIRRAIELYLQYAYDASLPPNVLNYIPPKNFHPRTWLMGPIAERDPPDAPFERVRSFALRLGNRQYPNMKLRLSRPPKDGDFLFSVDCHDAFMAVPPDSPDYKPLEELKRENAIIAEAIRLSWEQERFPTERAYLREKVRVARLAAGLAGPAGDGPPSPSR